LKNGLLKYAALPGSSDRFNPAGPSAIGDLRDAGYKKHAEVGYLFRCLIPVSIGFVRWSTLGQNAKGRITLKG
jgi:hypothetical protein